VPEFRAEKITINEQRREDHPSEVQLLFADFKQVQYQRGLTALLTRTVL
jgi:hypothetical protein